LPISAYCAVNNPVASSARPDRGRFGGCVGQLEGFPRESAFRNSVENAMTVDSIYVDYLTATLDGQI
jgi:hypothetical protein